MTVDELQAGQRAAVTVEHTFSGVFRGLFPDPESGVLMAHFDTDRGVGVPHPSSGRRRVAAAAIARIEVTEIVDA